MFGKSIRIYLSDGSPNGLRNVEIVNWSGQALACPRSRFSELKNWQESQRPGVYFLLENLSSDDKNTVYIGESENVFKRLIDHDRKKDFWNEVIIFTSRDENLTKSHIKYLESRLSRIAIHADRYIVKNGNSPTESSLPRADKDAMEEFIFNSRLVLGTLGHNLLEPIDPNTDEDQENENTLIGRKLYCSINGLNAIGKLNDEGFILLKDSEIAKSTTYSLPGKVVQLREKLIKENSLIENGEKFVLTKNILISSSSYAAAMVAGTSRSGPQTWKDSRNRNLKFLEEQLVKN